ncbi:hypothetical protein BJ684DRAFT_8315 [Piptocephalis cylindrospora]|uniref:Methyltransferase type 11 domain-containing protein n=1 Tax=Piptocephalis cylindrospora TaxID=1907219 RepID=A0A4P9Y6A3_9FUNG|nr:hypothetical protein BJ684DRAFT_8315 [Piptocephalis cylindrospora]|eukprot:RKP14598.1 hypothetical protein BJ684DRAFT_8315 [Piptocephalis cylindrospora]
MDQTHSSSSSSWGWASILSPRPSNQDCSEPHSVSHSHRRGGNSIAARENYQVPDLELEVERIGHLQDIITYSQRRLYRSPVTRPSRVLEVRSVSTKWMAEMARAFPESEVHGLTGSELPFPVTSPLPPNAQLHHKTILPGQPHFPPRYFDLIHTLCSLRYLPRERVPGVLSDMYQHTVPGGWVEIWEHMNELHQPGPTAIILANLLKEYVAAKGGGISLASSMDVSLKDAGFTQVQLTTIHLPLGEWGGTRGAILAEAVVSTLRNIADSLILVERKAEEGETFHQLISQWEDEFDTYQSSLIMYTAIGQRPTEAAGRSKRRTMS